MNLVPKGTIVNNNKSMTARKIQKQKLLVEYN